MRKTAVLALAAAMTLTMTAAKPVEPAGNEMKNTGSTELETKSSVTDGCEAGYHQWSEWTVTIPADCVTEGQQIRSCKECGISETASIAKTNEHDLKEISRQEPTEDKDGFVLYACKRERCSYQSKEVLPAKTSSDPGDKDEKETNFDSDTKDEDRAEENTENESKNDGSREGTTKKNIRDSSGDSNETSGRTGTEKDAAAELPDEDTDEEYASFAYSTSSEIVAEYDPETAVSTRKIVKDPQNSLSTEEVEGKAVPEETIEVRRNSEGNITDFAVSTALEEIRNGFSLRSEAKTLHSISVISEKDPSDYWITLSARKQASELGIRMKQNADGITITMTENEKPVQIVKTVDDEKKLTLLTSTGGSCVISKHIQQFELRGEYKNLKDINEISLHDMSSQKPYLELTSAEKSKSEESKTKEQNGAKDYWIQQYDDESETPIVITVYEKQA